MKLVITYDDDLKDFVKEEINTFSSVFEDVSRGVAVIDADYQKVIIESSLLETVGALIGFSSNIKDFKDFNFSSFISSSDSFKIKCPNRQVCMDFGAVVKELTKASVSLDNPGKIIIVQELDNKLLAYILLSGENKLSKRGYSVSNTEFIKPDTARALVNFSGWKDNGMLFDPFCHEGYTLIEAALKTLGVGPGFFKAKELSFKPEDLDVKKISSELWCFSTSMADIKFAKQNAKLARVFKYLRFGFHDLEDLDYNIKEGKIDYLITALPKKTDIKKLFFQLDYIMKKKCVITILASEDISAYKDYDFKIVEQAKIGDKELYRLVRE